MQSNLHILCTTGIFLILCTTADRYFDGGVQSSFVTKVIETLARKIKFGQQYSNPGKYNSVQTKFPGEKFDKLGACVFNCRH